MTDGTGSARAETWSREDLEALREECKEYLARTKASHTAVAKAIDYAPSTFGLWLRGDYTGNHSDLARAVERFLAREQEKAQTPPLDGPFAPTRQGQDTLAVLHYAHVHGTIGVVVGPSGTGKTATIKHYTAENPGVLILTIHPAKRSMAEVLHELIDLVGDPGKGRGTLGGMHKRLTAKLAGSGRLLIIDEAQYLEHQTIEVLRALHDAARIGLVFSGMPRLYADLVANTVELWEQIRTRVGIRKRLPIFSVEDVTLILRALDPRVSPEVCRAACEIGQHRGHTITHLYHHAARLAAAKRRAVTPADILAAQTFLYEPPAKPAPMPAPRPEPVRPLAPAAAKVAG